MKNSNSQREPGLGIVYFFGSILLFAGLVVTIDDISTHKIDGYINPGAKDTIMWTTNNQGNTTAKRVIEVVLFNGKTVEAIIPDNAEDLCVKQRDSLFSKGKRIMVALRENEEGDDYISWREIEQ